VCPGSNSFLGVGTAPLEKILLAGILPGIGTDSIASNECLDIWGEMQKLRNQFPDIPPEKIFAMATQGGAESLGRENDYGTLEKGKKGVFLEAVFDDINTLNETDVFDILTSAGKPEKLNWISPNNEI
jgi:cytosine/adenosine deaminase-related metal-dependent hydrolase